MIRSSLSTRIPSFAVYREARPCKLIQYFSNEESDLEIFGTLVTCVLLCPHDTHDIGVLLCHHTNVSAYYYICVILIYMCRHIDVTCDICDTLHFCFSTSSKNEQATSSLPLTLQEYQFLLHTITLQMGECHGGPFMT